jgi:Flp pilus assembly protein TadD
MPRGRLVVSLGIVAVTLVAFAPALRAGFLEWDDYQNFVANPYYRGLGWSQLRWMLTTPWSGHWTPMTWLTLGLDWVLWDRDPLGFHLTSLLWHAACAVAMFLVGVRLLAHALPELPSPTIHMGAAVSALVFAIHPLRVESVVWVSERRDVVSGLFYLLTILGYLRAAGAPQRRVRWLALSLVSFTLAITGKAIVMSLPVVLVVLDVYPLRRLPSRWREALGPSSRSVLLEKVPYVAIGLAGAAAAAATAIDFKTTADYPLWARPAVFGYNLIFYLGKTLVPLDLSPLYEMPSRWGLTDARLVFGLVIPTVMTVLLVGLRRRWPAGLAVWIAYTATLAPVAGLAVHVGPQIAADRYTYLAGLGPALLVGAGACLVARAESIGAPVRRLAGAVGVAALAGLAVLTWQQSQIWQDDVTLWQHAVALDPTCATCQSNLGTAQQVRAPVEAVAPLRRAVALRPDLAHHHANLGLVLLTLGRPAEALPHLTRAAHAHPEDLTLQSRLGAALAQTGDVGAALQHLHMVLQRRPDHVEALTTLGFVLVAAGRPAEALGYLWRAAVRAPRAPHPRMGLVRAHRALGDHDRAQRELAALRSLDATLAGQVEPQ